MAVSRQRFLQVGGFDESYFLYNEDVDLGRRLRGAGLGLLLRTDIVMEHLVGRSGDSPGEQIQQRGASMMIYLRRHHPPLAVEAMRLALSAGTVARGVAARARRDRERSSQFASYLTGLWRGAADRR